MAEPLTWVSTSRAEDLLFVGLVDALDSLGAVAAQHAAIVGGVMVEVLVRERALKMHRATRDIDIGIHVATLRSLSLGSVLEARD